MAVARVEALMADGALVVDVDNTAEIRQVLQLGRLHLLLWEGEEVVDRRVVETFTPRHDGLQIETRSLGWLLGSGADGPTIIDREFVAQNNLVTDPSFEAFGADATDPLSWKIAEGSLWTLNGYPYTGDYAAVMLGLPVDDDIITCDDEIPLPPYPTRLHVSAYIARAALTIPGRIRLRLVYEGGPFHPIDQIEYWHSDWARSLSPAVSSPRGDLTPIDEPAGTVLQVQTVRRQLIENPSFTGVLAGWVQTAGSWGTVAGPDGYIARTAGGGPAIKILTSDSSYYPTAWFIVAGGEEYTFSGWLSQEAGTDGIGVITCLVKCYPTDATKPDYYVEIARKAGDGDLNWYAHSETFTIPDGYNLIAPSLQAHLHTAGAWVYDNIHLYRTKGNTDAFTCAPMALASKRAYRWTLAFRSDPGASGTVQMRAVCLGDGRPTTALEGMTLAATDDGVPKLISWEFTTPSGYDVVKLQIWSSDVFGGAFYLSGGTLVETDTATVVADVVGPGSPYAALRPYTQLVGEIDTPPGATKARLQIIAEAGAVGYTVDDIDVHRVDAGPTLATDVVRALLRDPVTDLPILDAGEIHDAGPLGFDWRIRNVVCGDALATLSGTGQVNPAREHRVNGPARTYEWGLPAELFADRPDVILGWGQARVISEPETSYTIDQVVDYVRVIGAERTGANKTHQTITAEGGFPATSRFDAFGRALRTTRTVTDSTVDSYLLAAYRATLELIQAQPGPPSVTLEISDDRAWVRFAAGDWINVFTSDLVDPDNEMYDVDLGQPVWPVRIRVIERASTYTRGNRRIELVDPATEEAGEGLDITDAVRWSDKTSHRCTLGNRRPDYLTNPAGGSAMTQIRRFFATSLRT